MTIQRRVTLWYAVVLLISLLVVGGGMYYELIYERNARSARNQSEESMEEEMAEILCCFILPVLIITVVGGWWLLRRSLAPIDRLTRAAELIDAANLGEPLPRTFNGDEADRLSVVLNAMNQRLRLAMTEMHEFALHASHELRTPLTVLHGEIETMLGDCKLTPEQRCSLASQLDEIHRLTTIVEGLNLLARLNSGQTSCCHEPVCFQTLVEELAEAAAILGRPKGINVTVKVSQPVTILGDRHRLRQLFLNLADNAAKYNYAGGSITLDSQNGDDTVQLIIGNTGPGIREEDLPRVFKRFFRGEGSAVEHAGGVGLGLSIAQCIVEAHGGQISIDNTRPGWTMVRVFLPKRWTGGNQNLTRARDS